MEEEEKRPKWFIRLNKVINREKQDIIHQSEQYLTDVSRTKSLLKRFSRWYNENWSVIENMWENYPATVASDVLQSMFSDMCTPWTTLESYVLFRFLDPDNQGYFTTDSLIRLSEALEPDVSLTPQERLKYSRLLPYFDTEKFTVFLISVTSLAPNSLMHVKFDVSNDTTVGALAEILKRELDIPSDDITMKVDRFDAPILTNDTLLGTLRQNGSLNLFYDYSLGYGDCPLVNYDAYFSWRTIDRMLDI